MIMVLKDPDYEFNLSDPGYQFERFATGQRLDGKPHLDSFEHIQTYDLGSLRILFSAEVDAVTRDGVPVEITASDDRYWGFKKILQCVANGSEFIVHGQKRKTPPHGASKLVDVRKRLLTDLIREKRAHEVAEKRDKIAASLVELKSRSHEIEEGQVYELRFQRREMVLTPTDKARSMLPRKEVVDELLG